RKGSSDVDGALHEAVRLAVVVDGAALRDGDGLRAVALLEDAGVEGIVVGREAVGHPVVEDGDGDLGSLLDVQRVGAELEVLNGDAVAGAGGGRARRAPRGRP